MSKRYFHFILIFTMSFLALSFGSIASADDLTNMIADKTTINGILATTFQYQLLTDVPQGWDSTGRATLVFQPEIKFDLTEHSLLFAKLGFAAGNGLDDGTAPFNLSSWSVDYESDVKDINGSDRGYLLSAYYQQELDVGPLGQFGFTGGIINSVCYLDENAFANNPYTQFMNAALVNAPIGDLPKYDFGGAAEWDLNPFHANLVAMNVAHNDDGRNYSYFGLQLGYSPTLSFGKGNYRFIIARTSEDFTNVAGDSQEPLFAAWLSCDQMLNDMLGVWVRLGSQNSDAAIDYQNMFSGGVQLTGNLWRRVNDTVGMGFAFLNGGNQAIDYSYVFETYYRYALTNITSITADIQYLEDRIKLSDNSQGFIFSLRAVVEF